MASSVTKQRNIEFLLVRGNHNFTDIFLTIAIIFFQWYFTYMGISKSENNRRRKILIYPLRVDRVLVI